MKTTLLWVAILAAITYGLSQPQMYVSVPVLFVAMALLLRDVNRTTGKGK